MDMLTINIEDGFEVVENLVYDENGWVQNNIIPDLFSGDTLCLKDICCDMDSGIVIIEFKRFDKKGLLHFSEWPEFTMYEFGGLLKERWIKRI